MVGRILESDILATTMKLHFNPLLAHHYAQKSQQIRVMSEDWLGRTTYCPSCGYQPIQQFANNKPVSDFFCPQCDEQFELKSKKGYSVGTSVADGAYHTMLERISSDTNPNFFFLSYRETDYAVQQLVLVPKHFITAQMIVPRKKGIPNRPDYIMCSMNLGTLPEQGKIILIDREKVVEPELVLQKWQQTLFLRQQKTERKGWLLAIMKCIDRLPEKFTLKQMYEFEILLKHQFPDNNHIKDKIRQQLQVLRDKGIIEFTGRGQYRKLY